jgi:AcrR family transcriptional regulator
MPNLKSKLRSLREEELLSTAEGMLGTKGCQSFSNNELAETVGLGKGTIYSHYSSQSSLIKAVLARVSERLSLELRTELEGTGDAGKKLVLMVSKIVHEITACPPGSLRYPCCLRFAPCPHEGCLPIEQILLNLVERGMQAGTVRQDMDARLVARLFQNLLSAAVTAGSSHEEVSRHLPTVLKCYLNGIMNHTIGVPPPAETTG